MKILTVHGNSSSSQSWNYIKQCLPHHTFLDLSYDSREGFRNNLARMTEEINEYIRNFPEDEFVFLGHSLGSVYSAYLASLFKSRTLSVITLAAPWAGSEAATVLNMIAPSQLFDDIKPSSDVIRGLKKLQLSCHVTSIVSTSGQSSLWVKLNDGVLSRESMMALKGNVEYYEVCANHSEVLLHTDTVDIVEEAIEQAFQKSKANAVINEMEAA